VTSPPTNVLYVTGWNAPDRLLTALVSRLHPERVRYTVAVTDHPGGPLDDLVALGVDVHAIGPTSVPALPRTALTLRRLLDRTTPDVVHSNMFLPTVATELARLGRARPPSLLHRHYADIHHLLGKRAHVALDGWASRRATAVAAVSNAARDVVVREGAPRSKVHVVHNGLDVEAIRADPVGTARWRARLGGDPLLVTACRIDPQKDLATLLRSLAAVRAHHPAAVLAIAGHGEPAARDALLADARDLGIAEAVHLLGRIDDVHDLIVAADVYVQSSIEEGFGLSVLEAMALGVPVATTTPSGLADVVGDIYPWVPVREPAALAALILERLHEPERARALADRGVAHVRARFTDTRMADGVLALYRAVAT